MNKLTSSLAIIIASMLVANVSIASSKTAKTTRNTPSKTTIGKPQHVINPAAGAGAISTSTSTRR